jgi:hypothetical protein
VLLSEIVNPGAMEGISMAFAAIALLLNLPLYFALYMYLD